MEEAIKRIQGFCCKVDDKQWEVLVDAMDAMGVPVGKSSRSVGPTRVDRFARMHAFGKAFGVYSNSDGCEIVSVHELLAKLKGNTEAPEPSAPAAALSKLFNASVNSRQPAYPINCGDVTYLGLSKKEHFCLAMGVPETGDPELDDIIRKGEMKRIVATK